MDVSISSMTMAVVANFDIGFEADAAQTETSFRLFGGPRLFDELDAAGILVRSPSSRGVAEEAPGAYKDVYAVVEATEKAGLARKVARLEPVICIKG